MMLFTVKIFLLLSLNLMKLWQILFSVSLYMLPYSKGHLLRPDLGQALPRYYLKYFSLNKHQKRAAQHSLHSIQYISSVGAALIINFCHRENSFVVLNNGVIAFLKLHEWQLPTTDVDCRQIFKSGCASSNAVGIICPLGWNRVNWSLTFWVG